VATDRTCGECGHAENEHRGNGACMAVDKSDPAEWKLCPCNDYEPGRAAPRSTLRVLGEHGRAHERRMRKLRPAVFARDGFRCTALVSPSCTGRAENAHHVWPTEQGGPDEADNLASVCWPCHRWIHDEHPTDARRLGLLRGRV
jgi:5-methylcytosine-specific restriction endonuclease McrA